MKYVIAILVAALIAGCATTTPVGSRRWHENRLVEIDTAFGNGELEEGERLSLTNQADQTRLEYQEAARDRMRQYRYDSFYRPYRYTPFFHHHHHYRHRR